MTLKHINDFKQHPTHPFVLSWTIGNFVFVQIETIKYLYLLITIHRSILFIQMWDMNFVYCFDHNHIWQVHSILQMSKYVKIFWTVCNLEWKVWWWSTNCCIGALIGYWRHAYGKFFFFLFSISIALKFIIHSAGKKRKKPVSKKTCTDKM